MVRLNEYNTTINNNQQPLSISSSIVRQFVLLCFYLSWIGVFVHGQTNESTTPIINSLTIVDSEQRTSTPTPGTTNINSFITSIETPSSPLLNRLTNSTNFNNITSESTYYVIEGNNNNSTSQQSNLQQPSFEQSTSSSKSPISYYQATSLNQDESDGVNTQSTTITVLDVSPVIRSDTYTQSNNNLDNNASSLLLQSSTTAFKSSTAISSIMPNVSVSESSALNSSLSSPPIHAGGLIAAANKTTINATKSMDLFGNHSATICDPNRYTFDHQQVAKFFLTTMILLGFCCILIVIVLILVAYIYRKLSKGRNVKVSNKRDERNIEIDTIKDGRFYPLQDNVNLAFDDDDDGGVVGLHGTEFKFYGASSLPYSTSRNNQFINQGRPNSSTETFGVYHGSPASNVHSRH